MPTVAERQAAMRERHRPQRTRKAGRKPEWERDCEREDHKRTVLARARVFAEMLLRRGYDTVRVAQELRFAFPGLSYIDEPRVQDWIARGKPL